MLTVECSVMAAHLLFKKAAKKGPKVTISCLQAFWLQRSAVASLIMLVRLMFGLLVSVCGTLSLVSLFLLISQSNIIADIIEI